MEHVDFGCAARDEGGVAGRNNKGLVTMDRKTKKDSCYIYKAYWNPEPMVHLCGKRYVQRAGDCKDTMTLERVEVEPEIYTLPGDDYGFWRGCSEIIYKDVE